MKTDAIESLIRMREEFESGLTQCAKIGVAAREELAAIVKRNVELEAENAAKDVHIKELQDALGGERASGLWHHCETGHIKRWPVILCSQCRTIDHSREFNPEKLMAAQDDALRGCVREMSYLVDQVPCREGGSVSQALIRAKAAISKAHDV